MRSHPVVGVLFLVVGAILFALGALAGGAPGPLSRSPVPPAVLVPFVLWQLALWAGLLGVFFLRPRGTARKATPARA